MAQDQQVPDLPLLLSFHPVKALALTAAFLPDPPLLLLLLLGMMLLLLLLLLLLEMLLPVLVGSLVCG